MSAAAMSQPIRTIEKSLKSQLDSSRSLLDYVEKLANFAQNLDDPESEEAQEILEYAGGILEEAKSIRHNVQSTAKAVEQL